jgi:hypothetical protein
VFTAELMTLSQAFCYPEKIFSYFDIGAAFRQVEVIADDLEEALSDAIWRPTKLEVGKQAMLDTIRARYRP